METRVAVLENQNKQLIEELQALKEMYVHKHVGSIPAQDPTMVSLPKQVYGDQQQPQQHTLEHVLESAAASSSHAGGDAPQIHGKLSSYLFQPRNKRFLLLFFSFSF